MEKDKERLRHFLYHAIDNLICARTIARTLAEEDPLFARNPDNLQQMINQLENMKSLAQPDKK